MCYRLRAVSLFSWSIEQNARDTQMTTRFSEGTRQERPLGARARARVHSLTKPEEKDKLLACVAKDLKTLITFFIFFFN